LDYTSEDKDVILEKENGGLTFKFNYGLEKVSALIEGPTYGYCNLYVNGKAKVYFHEDRLGSTEYITDDFGGNVLSYIDYDPWGVPTNKATVMLGLRAVDLVAEYTGHPYDNVLSAYFAEARMYDAADRRFMAADPVKGGVANPLTLARYTYVLDNPLKWVDPLGLDAIIDAMAEEAIRTRLYGEGLGPNVIVVTVDFINNITGATERCRVMTNDPSLYNTANFRSSGIVEVINNTVNPESRFPQSIGLRVRKPQ
jgi:RHS repeat-associated protein